MYDSFDDDGGKKMPGHLTQKQMQTHSRPRMSTVQINKLKHLKKMKSSDDSDQYDVFDDDLAAKSPSGGHVLNKKTPPPMIDNASPGEENEPIEQPTTE